MWSPQATWSAPKSAEVRTMAAQRGARVRKYRKRPRAEQEFLGGRDEKGRHRDKQPAKPRGVGVLEQVRPAPASRREGPSG